MSLHCMVPREPLLAAWNRKQLQERFQWARIVLRSLLQQAGHSELQRSLLLNASGSATDFSGGCGGWEVAAGMIEAAGRDVGLRIDLEPRSVCDSCRQPHLETRTVDGYVLLPFLLVGSFVCFRRSILLRGHLCCPACRQTPVCFVTYWKFMAIQRLFWQTWMSSPLLQTRWPSQTHAHCFRQDTVFAMAGSAALHLTVLVAGFRARRALTGHVPASCGSRTAH